MADRGRIYTDEQLREFVREEMEAAGLIEAMSNISYLTESMKLLVGGDEDPRIPAALRPKPVIFDIRDKADAAATQAAATDQTLTAFMGTTNTQLAALQKGQQKAKSMFSRGWVSLFRQIDDDSGRIDWKRVGLMMSVASGIGAGIAGFIHWIPKVWKMGATWIAGRF